jgi:hypothetical protein
VRKFLFPLLWAVLLLPACSYRYYAEDLTPMNEAEQGADKTVADDGTVSYSQGRLEISLRPMTDVELNRQFSAYSKDGANSRNPYTFGNSTYFRTGRPRSALPSSAPSFPTTSFPRSTSIPRRSMS